MRSSSAVRPSSGPRGASTMASCMWPISCRRCLKSPAPAIRNHERAQNCPRSYGKSWGPMLAGQTDSPRTKEDYIAWEIFGNCAVRQGDWKIRQEYKSFGKGEWELFNLATDPGERKDLAAEHPDKLKAMTDALGSICQGQQRSPAQPLYV